MSSKYNSRIVAIRYYVPEQIVKTRDVEKKLKFKEKLGVPYGILERLTGCREHRVATPDTDATDLAVGAAEKVIKEANISKDEIDLVLFCACCQDITEPATANIVQEKLGMPPTAQVFDVKNACNSFVNGIDIADSMIATGKSKTALVTTGEVLSKYTDLNITKREDLELGTAGLTLGDGGGAAIMTKSKPSEGGLVTSTFLSYGPEWRLAVVMAGGTMYPREPVNPRLTYFQSNSEKILDLALEKIPPVILKVMKDAGWRHEDVDLVLGHQVTVKIIKDILEKAGFPFEKTVISVDRFGNTAAASIPITTGIALETGRLKRGMKVLLVGGASGFSVGVLALVW